MGDAANQRRAQGTRAARTDDEQIAMFVRQHAHQRLGWRSELRASRHVAGVAATLYVVK